MSDDANNRSEPFLSRWSRRKDEARREPVQPPAPATQSPEADEPVPQLPPVEELTIDSDFKAFFHPKVAEDTRRAALRKLFSDPHFNVMDGLDVYIDDYSKSEPIPAAMLAGLKQAQRILEWARNEEPAPGASDEEAPSAADATLAADAAGIDVTPDPNTVNPASISTLQGEPSLVPPADESKQIER
jgi:Protein of unknown function (DUF3306)